MSEDLLKGEVLIEGFDPEKIKELQKEAEVDRGWKEVYGAYQNRKILQAKVVGIEDIGSMTCAIVMVKDVRGIIPLEYFGLNNKRQLSRYIGETVAFKVVNYDREEEIFTGSRIEALEHMAEINLKKLEVGGKALARVTGHADHGLFIDLGGIRGRVPIDEIRYGWIDDLEDEYELGKHLIVKVLDIELPEDTIDEDGNKVEARLSDTRVTASAKALLENPWDGEAQSYRQGSIWEGTVSGVTEYGIFVNLADGIDSLAQHLKFENVHKGDKVSVRIIDVDVEKEQIRSRILRVL